MKNFKRFALYTILLICFAFVVVVYFNYPKLNIISGFSAKNMCSCMFTDHRIQTYTTNNDNNFTPVKLAKNQVNISTKQATATVYGLKPRTAVYRKGLGCVLVPAEMNIEEVTHAEAPLRSSKNTSLPYPYGDAEQNDTVFKNVDYSKVEKTVEAAFANNSTQKTRSVLVIYKDQIIAEKYADSLNKDNKMLGWSMTKSVLATLYGILQYEGKLDINEPAKVDAWQNDERASITYNDLLHMNSGLTWEEDYATISDVTKMLFLTDDMTKVQAEKEAAYPPNSYWNYSSGTTNLLSGLLRKEFNSYPEYLNFPYKKLIDRIGMHSMVIETDAAGNFVGSSYGWATTRDWGKFGLLYLHEGNWNGDRVFHENWATYVATPAPNSDGLYGGHFWLNTPEKLPDAPMDAYFADGFQGQRVYIVPSKDLVVVRMGLASGDAFDFNGFLSGITKAIK
ncbi:serine hydrolase domain-containing protein [Galbibacter pacificus]|uniref:Serine hydrolase n=1 Tax=Galbibacter pacificus TaxID=2996052 RepID=A0ABT6FU06_9FLAO|nr:serine hydrolase [Galbibacter pacificus]MDG3583273.1 serine hydrolase [Galbibacter pacificus]MDG3586754.1 serine hydrolase [Galbibacter pacificus]